MNKLTIIAAIIGCAIMTGCQTRITATKNAEVAHPIQEVVKVNGEDQVIAKSYQVTSGGWEATARSPLWAAETLKGLVIGVETNGSVRMELDAFARPLLPAVMVHDVEFTTSDGTVGSFQAANRRLLVNCIICACDAHPWHSWRRYALILEAYALYRACAKFGWIAWRLAYNKNNKNKR